MLKKRNLMDFFLVSKLKDAERPIKEWVMAVGKMFSRF